MTTAHSKMTLKIKGASDIQPSKDPYNYDNWIVEVSFADNSSRYHVAFYSEEGTLISESDVHSYQEACALTLPENRAYAMVSKILKRRGTRWERNHSQRKDLSLSFRQ